MIRLAVIGCGEHSHVHAKAVLRSPGIRITACCDTDENRAKDWHLKYGCDAYYTDIAGMLKKENIDGVIICTWPALHLDQIKICLSSGIKNILCEKSLAVSGREASEIHRLSIKYRAFIMEAAMYRHHPCIRRLEKLLYEGKNTVIESINALFTNYENEEANKGETLNWRLRPECGGGVPFDWLSYCVSASNHFSGSRPKRVYSAGSVNPVYKVIDSIYGIIEYDNGIKGIVESSRKSNFSQMLRINCRSCIFEIPVAWNGDNRIFRHKRKRNWNFISTDVIRLKIKNPYELQIKNFCSVIKGRGKPLVPLDESVINIYTIEALNNSLTSGNPVLINIPEQDLKSV